MRDAHSYAQRTIPELYRWFAGEAAPTSPTWEVVSLWVARTPSIAARLDALPGTKRQPNLFLGALKYLAAPLEPGPTLETWVHAHWSEVEALILRRATQTNELGRCAVIALAYLPEAERDIFIDRVLASGAHWLSFEGVGVLRQIREKTPDAESHRDTPHFIVALDGEPLGFCQPHGSWVTWYAG